MFERHISRMIYSKNKKICEFYLIIRNSSEKIKNIMDTFSQYNAPILSFSMQLIQAQNLIQALLFIDITDSKVMLEKLKQDLERTLQTKVYYKCSPTLGFMMDEFSFPLYVLPEQRSIILLEQDFSEMLKGFYKKFGTVASTFLYYLSYSGGKNMAQFLSKKLGLNGKELLVEMLKFYQTCGWGKIELIRYNPSRYKVVLRLYDSAECRALKEVVKPASHFIRGHISGLLSELFSTKMVALERKCVAKGDSYCEFQVERKR